jgi:hydrogenase maturation protein HypF
MKEAEADIATKVAPGQQKLGIMLPYTPLHELLLEPAAAFPRALVMTSANRRGEPIIHRDQPARELLAQGVDGMLVHNRPIEQRCDDSVFVVFEEDPYPLRRARGYAPFPIELSEALPSVLATGAELKHTFCLTKERRAFVSQHIGDLSNYETLQAFEQALRHFEGIFQIQPQAIAHDLHPDYLSTRLALEKSQAGNLPAYAIQHHQAHIASCLAEHQHTFDEPAMGFAYDGTGYGLDGTIWGGEAFVYSEGSFTRAFHLRSSQMPGGDQAIRQPWRLALAWLKAAGIDWDPDLPPMPDLEANQLAILEQQLDQGINSPATSSVGRLFDAVASLIGVRQQVHYEAQAAMELEALVNPAETGAYEFELAGDTFDPAPMLVELLGDLRAGLEPGLIAARFHRGLAQVTLDMSRRLRREYGLSKVALSGGVWQNLRLLQWTVQLLQADGFEPLLQRLVPANDGGISLGQAWLAGHYCTRDMDPAALPNITNGRIKE